MKNPQFDPISEMVKKRSPIDVDGKSYELSVLEIRQKSNVSAEPYLVVIQAANGGQSLNGELTVSGQTLADTEYVADQIAATMRAIVDGSLPPGTQALL